MALSYSDLGFRALILSPRLPDGPLARAATNFGDVVWAKEECRGASRKSKSGK
jgi:hypothetical protein